MEPKIDHLLKEPDLFEKVRTNIVNILSVEFANQKDLAQIQQMDTTLYDVRVFEELARPVNELVDFFDVNKDLRTVISVQYHNQNKSNKKSGSLYSFNNEYYILILCFAVNNNRSSSQEMTDRTTRLKVARTYSLIRQILQSGFYNSTLNILNENAKYIVNKNMFNNFEMFDAGQIGTVGAAGGRITLQIEMQENNILNNGVPLQGIDYTLESLETGEILAQKNIEVE